jgi:hypothetical protein
MRRFFLTYRDRLPEIRQMPSAKFHPVQKSQTPSGKFTQRYLPDKELLRRKLEEWGEELGEVTS